MNEAKQKKFLITVAYYGVIVVCVYLAAKFLLPPLAPFLIGFLFAWIIRKPAQAIAGKLHIKARIPALLLTAIFYICAAAVILFAGVQVVSALKDVLPRLPQIFSEQLMPLISNAFNDLKTWLAQFDPTVAANMGSWFSEFSTTLEQTISSLSSTALRLLSSLISGIPSMILKIVLTIVSTFFISVDFDRIIAFFNRILSEKQWNTLYQAKVKAVNSVKVFFKSYVLIFLMSFAELAVGFLIMRIPHAIGIALLVAVIDILPVLGTGVVLLPWAVVALVSGNIPLAVGMLILYVLMTVVRNIIEPKLVASQMGLNPLVTLMSMFAGLQLFGFVGMFCCPLLISLGIQLHRDKVIQLPFSTKTQQKSAA